MYKKDTATSRTRNTTFQTLIQAVQSYDEDDAFELFQQIRSSDSLESVAESVVTREKGATPTSHIAEHLSDEKLAPTDPFQSILAGKMSELMLDGSRKLIGGTSTLAFLPPGSELDEFRPAQSGQHFNRVQESTVPRWTKVTENDKLINHLMTMYFTWHYPFFTVLSKDLFYRDYVSGIPSQYCSSSLVNIMLALGCHFSSWEGTYEDPNNSATRGDHFSKEAQRLILENDEHVTAKLCTVQALALLSVREAGCAREGKGWVYSGMSFRMAFDLGLNVDASSLGTRSHNDEEMDARRITFWGCYFIDKSAVPSILHESDNKANKYRLWSNYLGRQPELSAFNTYVPKFDILPSEESAIWASYTDSGVSHEHAQPSRIRAVALEICKLAEISSDLLVFFYHPVPTEQFSKQLELKRLSEIHTRLESWKKNLPKEHDSKEGQLPQALLMQ